jgi:hypothetical protein
MARRSLPERLAQLEAQTFALKARLAKQIQAEDTRRKILLGSLVQQAIAENRPIAPTLRAWLQDALPAALLRPSDCELFEGWPPATPGDRTPIEAPPAGDPA